MQLKAFKNTPFPPTNNKLLFVLWQEIYKDRKKFSKQVFEVASSDLVNMGITVVSYTLKDIRDEEVSLFYIIILP